ncbi:MAG TPA: cytochrome P450 [Acidimicrobiales bacterium]|nr:cytochrome P450 [Acidimicrobiales bacterium]
MTDSSDTPAASGQATTDDVHARLAYERSARPRQYFAARRAASPVDQGLDADQCTLLRRPDVEHALRNWQDYSSDFGGIMGSEEPIIPLNVDPPAHVRYRRLLDPYFAPRKVAELQPAVQRHATDLVDGFVDRGSCDLSAELAVPLPCSTFLSLLGLPLDELDDLVRWKDIMIRPDHVTADPDEALRLQAETAMEIYGRFTAEVTDRRARPRDDLITYLTRAEIDGERLTDSELVRICFLLLAAGLDTVTISLECIFAFLLEHDDARRMVVDEPGSEVDLVEEVLRVETPVQGVLRRTTRDIELGEGVVLPEGATVAIGLASANVDPDGLPGADRVDVRRRDMRNLAFGGGPHRCLGSHLARMELRTVVRTWHDRIPRYSLAPGAEVVWNSSGLRGVDHLPLVWPGGGPA